MPYVERAALCVEFPRWRVYARSLLCNVHRNARSLESIEVPHQPLPLLPGERVFDS